MKDHVFILTIFLVSAILISGIFIVIFRSSLPSANNQKEVQNPKQKRFFFFALLAFVLIVLLTITIPKSPYFLFAKDTPAQVVYVNAQQFLYHMAYKEIDPLAPEDDDIELPVNATVEFRVTSTDVNHGFAIYNERAELVTQTQAMPGYVNRLRWQFAEPGKYNILCLEYCGAGHHSMRASFTVK